MSIAMGITATIVGWDPATRTWSVHRDEPGTSPLPEHLVGKLTATEEQLRWAAEDWGHLVHYRPRAVFLPTSADDVSALLAWASEHGLTVAARGAGHSVYGQAQAAGGIVIDMSGLAEIESISSDRITVQAGAHWSAVLQAAVTRQRTPPVLTDYLATSVGGTLSVGGVGGTSHRHGFQVDQLLAVEVATPRGAVSWCTPQRNRDLFDAVRSRHGQVGVITRAVLSLVPAPDYVRWQRLYYGDVRSYLTDQRRVVTDLRFDYLEGQVQATDEGTWGFLMEAVTYDPDGDEHMLTDDLAHDPAQSTTEWLPYVDFVDRMAAVETVERSSGAWLWPHPWVNVFIPDSHIHRAAEDTLDQVMPQDVGPDGVVLLYPLRTPPCEAPLLRLPDEDVVWLLAILRKGPPEETELVENSVAGNRTIRRRTLHVGGYAYQINYAPLTTADWQQHYGDEWHRLQNAKAEHDPQHILTPGQRMFDQ